MSYKLLKFATVYPEFGRQFLADNPDYRLLSFKQLNERFIATHYGWANYFAKSLNALGYEAEDVFVDIEPLQKSWADEHGLGYSRKNWRRDIVLAQAEFLRPDVLFLQDLYFFDPGFREKLREVCGKHVLMIGWHASPIKDFQLFKNLDLLLTCAPHFVEYMRREGANAELLLHAFEPSVLTTLPSIPDRDLDFTFIGSFVLQNGFHQERLDLVRRLMGCTRLQVWGEVSEKKKATRTERLISKGVAVARSLGIPEFVNGQRGVGAHHFDEYGDRFHQPVFGLRYYEILARSKTTFNSHIEAAEQYAGNMRLFEATGVGACLITDRKAKLSDMFELDAEVVTYQGFEECKEKVAYLLEHENERRAIAHAGQQRTLKCHTFSERAAQLDELIRRRMASN